MVFTVGALMNRAISSVGIHLFNKVKNSIFEKEQIEKTIIKKTDFESIIEDKIDLEEFPAISHKDIKAICKILYKSKSIELIIKNMYVYQSGMNKSLDEIREDFILLFPEKIELKNGEISLGTDERISFLLKVFDVLDKGIQTALNRAANEGSLGAHNALADRRHLDIKELKSEVKDVKDLIIAGSSSVSQTNSSDLYEINKKMLELNAGISRIQIQRENLLREFAEFAYSGNGIIVGSPGVGKTYIIKKFTKQLVEKKIPVLYLPVDKLGVETESALEKELGISLDIIDFLRSKKEEKSESAGLLLIDAFDAARSEKTQRIFISLIRRVKNELDGLWNIIVSVRIYDAKKSEDLLDLFPDPDRKPATQGIYCRHLFVPKLTDEEIIEAIETISCPIGFFNNISPDLKELFRTPFNLWILEKLLIRNPNIPEISSISSEVQLLSLFWKQRITDGIIGENRQMLVTKITQRMVEERSLSVNKVDFYPVNIDTWISLLSSEILVNVSTTSQKIAFSHNILFDYAVSVLLMEDSPDKLIEFIEEDASRPLFLRPSLIYYFTRIWYSDPQLFWDYFWYILPNENIHLRLFARFLPTGVIANEAREIEQLASLVNSLEKKEHFSTKAVLYLLQALRALGTQRDKLWVQFLDKIAAYIDKEFAWDLVILTSEILKRTEKKDDDKVFQICGNVSRTLLKWIWQERNKNPERWIDSLGGNWVTFLVAETFSTNPHESRKLLEKVLDLRNEENFPINYIFRLTDSLKNITLYDPSFTSNIYLTVLTHVEKSKEPTYFGTPVLPLSSTRDQDFEMCHYNLIKYFPNFLETESLLAAETVIKCLNNFIINEHVLPYYKEEQLKDIPQKFQFRGKLVYYIPDGSHIWWDNGGSSRDEPTKMLETLFEFIYEKSLKQTNVIKLETIIDLLRDNACVAIFWKLLLKTAIREIKIFAPLIFDLCASRPIQINSDTTYELGEFLQAASTSFTEEHLYQIERSILHIPEGENDDNYRKFLEKDRNRLLTRIPPELIKTNEGKRILEEIKKTNEIPENKQLVRFESFSKAFSEYDWFEEHGIDLSEICNEEVISYFPKLNEFAAKWQNGMLIKTDTELIFSDVFQLYNLLDKTSGAHEDILNSAWTKLGSCAKIMVENCNSESVFDLCRTIVLTCSKHAQPDPNLEYNLQFSHPSWSPSPRTEAAQGLSRIIAVKYDEEILSAIKCLTHDKVPSVRFLMARELSQISKNASNELWELMEEIIENEDNQLVLQSLCYSLNRLVKKEENKTVFILEKLIDKKNLSDQNSPLLEAIIPLIVWLALVRENKWAIETYLEVIREPIKYSEALKIATFETVTIYLKPQSFDSVNNSKVAERAINWLLETIDSVRNGVKELKSISKKDASSQSKLREMYDIIDEIVTRLYFAFDTSDKDRGKNEELLSEKQMVTFYRAIDPLLVRVLKFTSEEGNIMPANTAHYFMQLLNYVLRYDPKSVLGLASKVAKSSQASNYNLDGMAIDEVVKLVEKILADYKLEIRNEDSIRDLLDLLDIFAISGSPEALKLIWQLDKVFR